MASKFKYYNNYKSTTMDSPLLVAGTTVNVADAGGMATPAAGYKLRATLVSPSDASVYEIINITAISSLAFTITRAQEGTTAREWPYGTIISCRLTAEMSQTLLSADFVLDLTNNALGTYSVDLQTFRTTADRAATGAGATAVGHDNKASGQYSGAVGWDNDCTAQLAWAAGVNNTVTGIRGFALGFDNAVNSDNGLAVGRSVSVTGTEAIGIGDDATVNGVGAIALGKSSSAVGVQSVAIGTSAVVAGDYSANLLGADTATGRTIDYSSAVGGGGGYGYIPFDHAARYHGLPFIAEHDFWFTGTPNVDEVAACAGGKVVLYSIPIQLGDGARPGTTASVKHGDSFIAGGYIYTAYCWISGYFGTGTTAGSAPTLTTTPGATTTDGTVQWICVGATSGFSLEMLLPDYARFTPTSVGVMAKWSTPGGGATYPQLTFGVNGSLASWLAATTHSKLTGDYSNHMTAPTATVGAKQFGAAVSTFGTDLDCVGVIVWEGFIRESDVA